MPSPHAPRRLKARLRRHNLAAARHVDADATTAHIMHNAVVVDDDDGGDAADGDADDAGGSTNIAINDTTSAATTSTTATTAIARSLNGTTTANTTIAKTNAICIVGVPTAPHGY